MFKIIPSLLHISIIVLTLNEKKVNIKVSNKSEIQTNEKITISL